MLRRRTCRILIGSGENYVSYCSPVKVSTSRAAVPMGAKAHVLLDDPNHPGPKL